MSWVRKALAFLQVRIMLSVLQFRLNRRYVEAQPPFIAIELDQSDSGREGCAVSTLTITSEPKDWRGAIQVLRAAHPSAHFPLSQTSGSSLSSYKSWLLMCSMCKHLQANYIQCFTS